MTTYSDFLGSKVQLAPKTGFALNPDNVHPVLFPHQRDVVVWNCLGGRRADFLNFSLGKTIVQLETARQIINERGGSALIVCPLSVAWEFQNDGQKLGIDRIKYITSTTQIEDNQSYYITNYERIRRGQIDANQFTVVCFDEASILRSLDTETTQTILETFQNVPFRFVSTATPAPNRYLEFINYADYLGIMDRGQALTRFFERDSTTAGNLKLHPRRAKEFWSWMSSWACFITKPSDLGYSDEGYDLPELEVIPHRISIYDRPVNYDPKTGQGSLISDATKSLPDAAREKKRSIPERVTRMAEIVANCPSDNWLIWHHLEPERLAIQKSLGNNCKSVWGSQNMDQREEYLRGFAQGNHQYLSTKPSIAGSGCNFQYHCHKSIFVGINYEFNDWIQALHRIYRFKQAHACQVHVIYTDAEDTIYQTLMTKWENHRNAQYEMTSLIKKHGLNSDLLAAELNREMFNVRQEATGENWTSVNNDSVDEWNNLPDNSQHLIVTSIPFGNHYSYSENYNCFGHNEDNVRFFEQMDFLVPNLLRVLMPGRIACIHVKDRLRYSYQNGTGFSSLDPFSDDTVASFRKHGFQFMSRITVDTDVVRENNGTYRLSWTEACKDMTKMGAGLPEYVLVFRKAPTSNANAYADLPVVHSKAQYTVGKWQLDAHAHWSTSGERLMSTEALKRMGFKSIMKLWKELDTSDRYDYDRHVALAERLDEIGRLSKEFMVIPPQSRHPDIWDDITRMKTLNSAQVNEKNKKHICPLQLDIIQRCIERYSNPGELVADPFNGIGSVLYQAVKMGRRGFGCELKAEYWADGLKHIRAAEASQNALTLFDMGQPINNTAA